MNKFLVSFLFFIFLFYASCIDIDFIERHFFIEEYKWFYNKTASLKFAIKDTVHPHKIYFIIKHKNAFNYLNLWLHINAFSIYDTIANHRINIRLGNNELGWFGSGMDNIFERRIFWNTITFPKQGEYSFNIQQIMRDNPLEDIISVGIRIDRVN